MASWTYVVQPNSTSRLTRTRTLCDFPLLIGEMLCRSDLCLRARLSRRRVSEQSERPSAFANLRWSGASQSEVLKHMDDFCAVANSVPGVLYSLLLIASEVPRNWRGLPRRG